MISCDGINFIDSQDSGKLRQIIELVKTYAADIRLARAEPAILAVLRRDSVIDQPGEEQIYGNVYEGRVDHIPESPSN